MSDTDIADELFPVTGVTEVVQAAIRCAPHPERQRMWRTYCDLLESAQEDEPGRMPWEPAGSVTKIRAGAAKTVMITTLRLVRDDDVYRQLLDVAAKKAYEITARDDQSDDQRPPGKLGVRQCARPGCNEVFSPMKNNARYHSDNCRKRASQQRIRSSRAPLRK